MPVPRDFSAAIANTGMGIFCHGGQRHNLYSKIFVTGRGFDVGISA
jgi:hypothetical protein